MAEFVQQRIEEMLPELEQMKRVELFTEKETKQLLKKRKAYEYRLQRRTKQKEDYINYAQYEMNVLKLLLRRRKKVQHRHKFKEIEVPITNRIHNIFRQACLRFSDDVKLWMSHIDFCKTKNQNTYTSRIYARMLQAHNTKPTLWVSAAKFELEECSSMENARSLLQRGLRHNPRSKVLWREYFRMELLFCEKMRMRREMLGIAAMEQDEASLSDAVLDGAIAFVVFTQACDKIPGDVEFAVSFLPICQQFQFTDKLYEDIMDTVRKEHGQCELVWNAEAWQYLHAAANVRNDTSLSKKEISSKCVELEEKCYETFEEAVKTLPTERMFHLYLTTLLEKLANKSEKHQQRRLSRLLLVFEKASEVRSLAEEDSLKWVEVLQNSGQSEVLNEAVVRITDLHPSSAGTWLARLSYNISTEAAVEHVMDIFRQAIRLVPANDSLPLWTLMYDWLRCFNSKEISHFLQEGLASDSKEVVVRAKIWSLEWAALNDGADAAKQLYKQLSTNQPLTLEFFQTYIDIIRAQAKLPKKHLRSVYEDALREYGSTSIDLWLSIIKFERSPEVNDFAHASQLHWRAMRTLQPELVEDFVTQYTLLQTQPAGES